MEASPLTRQPQPEVFTPKIIHLYDSLFKVCQLLPPHHAASPTTTTLTRCPSRFANPSSPNPALPPRAYRLIKDPSAHKDDDDTEKSEGFWREFFLHRPDRAALRTTLNEIPPAEVLQMEARTRELFSRAVSTLKSGRSNAPSNALDVRPSCAVLAVCSQELKAM
jgi:hypothetical protein